MLKNCWKKQLKQRLKPLAEGENFRLAILGIGNELNGDDSAGVMIARKIQSALLDRPNLLVLDCGTIPENAGGALRRFKPHLVLMMDAADLGAEPGDIREVDLQQVRGFSASSHSLPLSVLAEYFQSEFHCESALFCIQPQTLDYCAESSAPVKQAVDQLVAELILLLDETKS